MKLKTLTLGVSSDAPKGTVAQCEMRGVEFKDGVEFEVEYNKGIFLLFRIDGLELVEPKELTCSAVLNGRTRTHRTFVAKQVEKIAPTKDVDEELEAERLRAFFKENNVKVHHATGYQKCVEKFEEVKDDLDPEVVKNFLGE